MLRPCSSWVRPALQHGGSGDTPCVQHLFSYPSSTPYHVAGTAAVNIVLCWIPYELLVQTSVLLSTSSLLMLYIVFVYFRFTRPNMIRPYAVSLDDLAPCPLSVV